MIANLPARVFLCGFMGAGKTTVGRKLADRLNVDFLDLDDRIEEKAEKSIPAIFEESGEAGFRIIERRELMEVSREYQGVVALGGGSLQNQHIVDHLKLNGLLIFLEVPLPLLLSRLSEDRNRPLLLDKEGNMKDWNVLKQEMETLYRDRVVLYEQAVIRVTDDGSETEDELVEVLLKKIRNHVEFY